MLENTVATLKIEVSGLRDFRHAANGTLHSHDGKLNIIDGQQKSMVNELTLMRKDINEWMRKTNHLLTWQLKIKFMLLGGTGVASVGLVLIGGIYYMLKFYLDYYK